MQKRRVSIVMVIVVSCTIVEHVMGRTDWKRIAGNVRDPVHVVLFAVEDAMGEVLDICSVHRVNILVGILGYMKMIWFARNANLNGTVRR